MLERHHHPNDIFELRMARPPVNALNPALLGALRDAIEAAPSEGARGLIISGGNGIFSAGLDVPYLLTLDRSELEQAWRRFFEVCSTLAKSPIPVVAAIGGHSPAGGAVISLFCDYRIMAEGSFRIGLNEVQVGLVVPECIQYALRRQVGTRRAERLLVSGAMIEAADALRLGVVDELAAPDQVVDKAVHWLQNLLALPRGAMLGTRQLARADLIAAVEDPARLDLGRFIDAWFGNETQGVLRAMVQRLKEKRG